MAEKEEITQNNRIINAEKYKRRIKKGRIYIDVRDKKLNCLLSKVFPRQEAIERMAKSLIRADYPSGQNSVWQRRWENPDSKLYYLTMAEAALNALLEDNNER